MNMVCPRMGSKPDPIRADHIHKVCPRMWSDTHTHGTSLPRMVPVNHQVDDTFNQWRAGEWEGGREEGFSGF